MMRTLGIVVALTLLVVAAGSQPAHAICGNAYLITALDDGGYVTSNPDFVIPDGAPGCYGSGGYDQAPTSPSFQAHFWGLTVGNPAIGLGADNGVFSPDVWIYGAPPFGGNYFYYRQLFTNWAANAQIDGCVADAGPVIGQIDGTECTCILMTDQWNGVGYFALLGKRVNVTSDFVFDDPGQTGFRLQPIPKPTIVNSVRNPSTFNLDSITVRVDPGPGIFDPDGCGCAAGYKIVATVLPRGSMPPSDRTTATTWTELSLAGGGVQAVTPLGATVDVESLCGASNTDVYLAAQIVGDSGFTAANVSENSTRIECGPQLADPMRPAREPADRPLQLRDRRQQGGSRGK
jgi:hypothetical protein